LRALMIGAGGMAAGWIRTILPSFADRLSVVGLADVSAAALADSGDFLGLGPEQRFSDMRSAFDAVEADCCLVVVPAAFHAEAIVRAAERHLPVLCEKPLAADWAACCEAYAAARRANLKVEVVQ